MDKFLADCKELNLKNLSDEHLLTEFEKVKNNVNNVGNRYVDALLNQK